MPRGGKRKGAGRKSAWNAGKTKAVKLPESLIPEIVEFARTIDSTLVNGLYGEEKVDSQDRLVDILFDELDDRHILEQVAKKLLTRSANEEEEEKNQFLADPETTIDSSDASEYSEIEEADSHITPNTEATEDRVFVLSTDEDVACGSHAAKAFVAGFIVRVETGLSLTPDQSVALEKMKQFVQTPRQTYFRLTGYAGTGKSYLIVQLMKWLLNQKINFVGGSPTNKAVKNLNKLAAEAKIRIEAHTVARLLGQQPELNEETGKEEFIAKGTDSIGGYQIALIDEFSMISKSNFKDINQAVWHTPTKVIFVGDAAQLPPVGESEPIVATHEYIQHEATLSSIVRYDGDIAHVAEEIRSDRVYNQQLYPFQTTSDKTITCLSRDDWLKCA